VDSELFQEATGHMETAKAECRDGRIGRDWTASICSKTSINVGKFGIPSKGDI